MATRNTIELERLVRRITGVLKGEGDPSVERKLADDFCAISAGVALRLEQCRTMIEAGAAAQAIQLAETAPNLLDLVTLLEFRQAEEWRQYCRSKGLASPEKLSPQSVSALNQCYASGITPQHPAYAVYREAVFEKNTDAAVTALRSIVRLNPADANAAAELDRLDAKILATRLATLDQLLGNDEDAAIRELDGIETFGFKTKITGAVWQRAQTIRCGKLFTEAEEMMVGGWLPELVNQLDFLAELRSKHGLDWPREWTDRFDTLQSWCRAESAARQKDDEYQGLKNQLCQSLEAGTEQHARAKNVKYSDMKAERETLVQLYQHLEMFLRPLPAGVEEQYRAHTRLLEQKIQRQARVRQILVTTSVTTAVIVLGAMGVAFLALQRANTLTMALNQAQAKHQVRVLQALLKRADGGLLFRTPQLKAACAAAASEIASRSTPLAGFEAAFAQLPDKFEEFSTIQKLEDVTQAFVSAQQAQRSLTGDLQQESQARLDNFHARWSDHCSQILPAVNETLAKSLHALETDVAGLDATQDLNQFRAGVVTAISATDHLAQSMDSLSNFCPLQADLTGRCQAVQAMLNNDHKKLSDLDDTVDALDHAKDVSTFATAITALAAIPIRQSQYCQLARLKQPVLNLKADPKALARALLAGTNSFLWTTLQHTQSVGLTPAQATSDGRQRFMDLERDYAVNGNHHCYRLYTKTETDNYVEWITAETIVPEEGWKEVQGWKVDANGPCKFERLEIGYFDGKYRTSNLDNNLQIRDTDLSGVTAAWAGSEFNHLINPRDSTFGQSPLKVADSLCAGTNGSPLFRAYLLQQLIAIMALQPDESGLNFTPALRSLAEKLDALGADEIRSGDWFVASRVAALQGKFQNLFASLPGASFQQPAKAIFKAVSLAARQDFVYAGYVKPDGTPKWSPLPAEGCVFGYRKDSGDPGLLYTVRAGEVTKAGNALPLTPMLLFDGDLADIMAQSGIRPGDPLFKGLLPPLLRASTNPP